MYAFVEFLPYVSVLFTAFTVFLELLSLLLLKNLLLVRRTDLESMSYTVIAMNFITHPYVFFLSISQQWYPFGPELPYFITHVFSDFFYSGLFFLFVIEIVVISVESIVISWSMRYSVLRSFAIAFSIQIVTIAISLIWIILGYLTRM